MTMKKLIVLMLMLFVSLSCLSGKAALPKTEIQNTPSLEMATEKPAETALPPTEVPTLTATVEPTSTEIPATATPDPVDEIHARIAEYHNDELEGLVDEFRSAEYNPLDDDSYSGAIANSLFRFPYDLSPTEFLAIADVEWEHPTSNITKSSAGCGYVFYDDEDNRQIYYVLFTLDNQARLTQVRDNYWDGIAHVKDNSLNLSSPNGNAQIMLVLLGQRLVFAVNGKIMIDQTVDWQSSGQFGYSVLSGTFKDYGTRCNFKNSVVMINK
jgi:hypothetical protein